MLFNVLFQLSYKCLKEHYNWIYNMCFEWFHMKQYLCLVFIWYIYYFNPFIICLSEYKVLIERCLYASYDASYELGAFGNILLTSQAQCLVIGSFCWRHKPSVLWTLQFNSLSTGGRSAVLLYSFQFDSKLNLTKHSLMSNKFSYTGIYFKHGLVIDIHYTTYIMIIQS